MLISSGYAFVRFPGWVVVVGTEERSTVEERTLPGVFELDLDLAVREGHRVEGRYYPGVGPGSYLVRLTAPGASSAGDIDGDRALCQTDPPRTRNGTFVTATVEGSACSFLVSPSSERALHWELAPRRATTVHVEVRRG